MLGSKELKVQHKTRTSLCWRKGSRVVDDNTNHRGQGWYFSSWTQLTSWKSSECRWWSRHNCWEISWRCNRSAMASSQRNDEVKGYWNQGYDTNSKQARSSRRSVMTRKIDVSLAHHRKFCSGKKDQVAQLNFCTIMIWPIRLGMTWRVMKLVSNENYLGVIESEYRLDSLFGVLGWWQPRTQEKLD